MKLDTKLTWHETSNVLHNHRHTPPQDAITATAASSAAVEPLLLMWLLPATVLD
jgi:hypothetical protein